MSAVGLLAAARAVATRRARQRPASPAQLAKRLIPNYVVTPTISLISDVLADAVTQPDRRYILSCPPRTGKSQLVSVIGPLWALSRNSDTRIILASYADTLAQEHSHAARALIAEHAGELGFALRPDKTAVGRWLLDGHNGGLLAAGILSGIVGFGADLLLLDDVVKNAQEAESAAYRRNVIREFKATLMTRLHPRGSVVIIGCRTHEADLIGTLLAEEPQRWTYVNIPAVSEAGIPDALGRAPGAAMVSALGRTPEQFADLRASVSERVWYGMFQGVPADPQGALVKRSWLDQWRLACAPSAPTAVTIGVDPADSGEGDACGIVAASMTRDGVVAVVADKSARLTSDQWARAAVELAIDVGASEIAVESYTAGTTYVRVVTEALARYKIDHPIRVTAWPPKGSGRGRGDAMARSAALLQGFEVGTVRIAGFLPDLESQAVQWQAGAHQPDSLAALVVAHDVLTYAASRQWSFIAPPLDVRINDRPGVTPRRAGQASVTPIEEALRLRQRISPIPGRRRAEPAH